MLRYFFHTIILLLLSTVSQGQAKNPFELKYSKKKNNPTQAIQVEDTLSESLGLSIEDELEGAVLIQTPPLQNKTDTQAVEAIDEATSTEVENPFDLNNTPIDAVQSIPDKVKEISNPLLETVNRKRWIFWIFLITLFLLAIIVNFNRQILGNVYRSILNSNYSNLLYRGKGKRPSILYFLLYLIFVINAGLFIYLFVDRYSDDPPTYFSIASCIGLVAFIYAVRHGFLFLLGNIFPIHNASSQYRFNVMFFNIFLGMILIPLNLFIAYGPDVMVSPLLVIGAIFMLILFVLRQIRGLFISRNALIFHKFHFFMYLCTIEIAPYFALYNLFSK